MSGKRKDLESKDPASIAVRRDDLEIIKVMHPAVPGRYFLSRLRNSFQNSVEPSVYAALFHAPKCLSFFLESANEAEKNRAIEASLFSMFVDGLNICADAGAKFIAFPGFDVDEMTDELVCRTVEAMADRWDETDAGVLFEGQSFQATLAVHRLRKSLRRLYELTPCDALTHDKMIDCYLTDTAIVACDAIFEEARRKPMEEAALPGKAGKGRRRF